jgi:hypothetical protein
VVSKASNPSLEKRGKKRTEKKRLEGKKEEKARKLANTLIAQRPKGEVVCGYIVERSRG